MPELLYAVVARPPVLGWEIAGFESGATLATPGVEAVVQIGTPKVPLRFAPLGGIAVLARNTWAALRGRDALNVSWRPGRESAAPRLKRPGMDCDVPDFVTAPVETPSATARVAGGACEVWTCVKRPVLVRADLANLLGVRRRSVTLTATVIGGGPGRISRPTYATEAAMLSRHMGGVPVQLLWTRDDDMPLRHSRAGSPGRPVPKLFRDGPPSAAWLTPK